MVVFAIFAALSVVSCGRSPTTIAGSADSRAENSSAKTRTQQKRRTPAESAKPSANPHTEEKRESPQQYLDDAVSSLVSEDSGHVAVAVDDLTIGESAAYDGNNDQFVTASIVKVDILATLLYQLQKSGGSLTSNERELATTMIENSNNNSASSLYDIDGGASAIDDANRVFGLTGTVVGTDGYWGLTTTTTDDQIQLLRQVFTDSSALSSSSRSYIQSLMSQVEIGRAHV